MITDEDEGAELEAFISEMEKIDSGMSDANSTLLDIEN
jgi:hypothetical protein